MEINDNKFHDFLGEFREMRGEVRADIKNLGEHISAVSKKADRIHDSLESHKDDQGAHGADAREKHSGSLVAWLALGSSCIIGIVDMFFRKNH